MSLAILLSTEDTTWNKFMCTCVHNFPYTTYNLLSYSHFWFILVSYSIISFQSPLSCIVYANILKHEQFLFHHHNHILSKNYRLCQKYVVSFIIGETSVIWNSDLDISVLWVIMRTFRINSEEKKHYYSILIYS